MHGHFDAEDGILNVAGGITNVRGIGGARDMDMGVMVDAWGRAAEKQAQMLKALYDNGIRLVPGSDAMAPFTIHRELELYAEAGIPGAAVLRIATLDSARVVGADDSKGSIAPGKDADLVLLDGNPLEDISAVRRGLLVIRGERCYRPEELYRAFGVRPFLPSTEIPQAAL
jgi:predicted amidohydrolase YtcJ